MFTEFARCKRTITSHTKTRKLFTFYIEKFEQVIYCLLYQQMILSDALKSIKSINHPII